MRVQLDLFSAGRRQARRARAARRLRLWLARGRRDGPVGGLLGRRSGTRRLCRRSSGRRGLWLEESGVLLLFGGVGLFGRRYFGEKLHLRGMTLTSLRGVGSRVLVMPLVPQNSNFQATSSFVWLPLHKGKNTGRVEGGYQALGIPGIGVGASNDCSTTIFSRLVRPTGEVAGGVTLAWKREPGNGDRKFWES